MQANSSLTSMWRKSSFSSAGNCVEVGNLNGSVLVSDSKSHSQGRTLSFPSSTWREFVQAIYRGDQTK
jgi:hypothetical protein